MPKIIVVTGTPGSGKTTISRKITKAIRNSVLVSANEIVERRHAYFYKDRDGSKVVNMGKLKNGLKQAIEENKGKTVIIEGHILCDMRLKGATAIVVREHLATIKRRLEGRRYGILKIRDNIVSEATDYCGINSRKNYARVFEVMNGKAVVKDIIRITNGKGAKFMKDINLLDELTTVIKKDKRFAI